MLSLGGRGLEGIVMRERGPVSQSWGAADYHCLASTDSHALGVSPLLRIPASWVEALPCVRRFSDSPGLDHSPGACEGALFPAKPG